MSEDIKGVTAISLLVCERLQDAGIAPINGPMDRPWGIRTASFQDPAGHMWEIAHPLGR